MRWSDLIGRAGYYSARGAAAAAVLAALFCLGYFFVYKKLMKGAKRLPRRTAPLAAISLLYLAAVFGAVFLSRGQHYGDYVLWPFASYVQAWNEWSAAQWRNILLNIAMFVPFGFLLPLWGKRFERLWRVVLCGFAFSLAIELVQLATAAGIFETDDLIGNTFGASIGYGLSMLFLSVVRKERPPAKKILGYLMPLFLLIAAFCGILAAYSLQELGNLRYANGARADMTRIALSSEASFSEETGSAMLYRLENTRDPEAFAKALFQAAGTTLDPSQTLAYDESAYYYAPDRGLILSVAYLGGTYRYTDCSGYGDDVSPLAGAEESTVRAALRELGMEPPKGAVFSETGEGSYAFIAAMADNGDTVADGILNCTYYADATVKLVENGIRSLRPYRAADILSEAEAYAMLEDGRFAPFYFPGEVSFLRVTGVERGYAIDSKGFYVPVYRFSCVFGSAENQNEALLVIPAMR